MPLDIPVITDEDLSRSPTAKNRLLFAEDLIQFQRVYDSKPRALVHLMELDAEDLIQIQRLYDSKPRAAVPDVEKCGGLVKLLIELLYKKLYEPETDDEDSDGSEEEMKMKDCRVCMKENGDHMSYECPYLECIPDPKDTPVGEAYMIVCAHCGLSKHGHQDGTWEGRAIFDFRKSSLFVRQPTTKFWGNIMLLWKEVVQQWILVGFHLVFRKPGVVHHRPDANDEVEFLA